METWIILFVAMRQFPPNGRFSFVQITIIGKVNRRKSLTDRELFKPSFIRYRAVRSSNKNILFHDRTQVV